MRVQPQLTGGREVRELIVSSRLGLLQPPRGKGKVYAGQIFASLAPPYTVKVAEYSSLKGEMRDMVGLCINQPGAGFPAVGARWTDGQPSPP